MLQGGKRAIPTASGLHGHCILKERFSENCFVAKIERFLLTVEKPAIFVHQHTIIRVHILLCVHACTFPCNILYMDAYMRTVGCTFHMHKAPRASTFVLLSKYKDGRNKTI